MNPGVGRRPELEAALRQRVDGGWGTACEWYRELGSTNARARFLADTGAPHGLVLVADRQTAGRGQRGRAWESPEGGLWFSVLLRPGIPPDEVAGWMPRCGAAVATVLRAEFGLDATVKHPNDVLVGGKKVCGILAEAVTRAGQPVVDSVVVGVGMNRANPLPPELEGQATSLVAEGVEVDGVALLGALLAGLRGALGCG